MLNHKKKNFNLFDNLFEFRSRTLLSKNIYFPKSELLGYLIGNEISSNINKIKKARVVIIGSRINSELYSEAMNRLKVKNTIVDSKDITINGLKIFYKKLMADEKK